MALATAAIVAPVTLLAKTDTENHHMIPMVAAPAVARADTMPLVTPSKYITAASAHVRVVVPPGQPRKCYRLPPVTYYRLLSVLS